MRRGGYGGGAGGGDGYYYDPFETYPLRVTPISYRRKRRIVVVAWWTFAGIVAVLCILWIVALMFIASGLTYTP